MQRFTIIILVQGPHKSYLFRSDFSISAAKAVQVYRNLNTRISDKRFVDFIISVLYLQPVTPQKQARLVILPIKCTFKAPAKFRPSMKHMVLASKKTKRYGTKILPKLGNFRVTEDFYTKIFLIILSRLKKIIKNINMMISTINIL